MLDRLVNLKICEEKQKEQKQSVARRTAPTTTRFISYNTKFISNETLISINSVFQKNLKIALTETYLLLLFILREIPPWATNLLPPTTRSPTLQGI